MTNCESHPLEPFLPSNAKVLMLGSFPPSQNRWSMDFYYPNWQNDMWRILGIVFFHDKDYFTIPTEKRFDKEKIIQFLSNKGIALSDTAEKVRRLKDNASDKFLEIIEQQDIFSHLRKMPTCHTIITTGEKASTTLGDIIGIKPPATNQFVEFQFENRNIKFYRLVSSSRAYPLSLEKKAEFYKFLKNL